MRVSSLMLRLELELILQLRLRPAPSIRISSSSSTSISGGTSFVRFRLAVEELALGTEDPTENSLCIQYKYLK